MVGDCDRDGGVWSWWVIVMGMVVCVWSWWVIVMGMLEVIVAVFLSIP